MRGGFFGGRSETLLRAGAKPGQSLAGDEWSKRGENKSNGRCQKAAVTKIGVAGILQVRIYYGQQNRYRYPRCGVWG
jgi:hypothetical protein